MSRGQTLRALVNERLAAAAEDIFVLFERTIAEYEEELCRSKEENQRKQQLLDKVLYPRVELVRGTFEKPSTSPGAGLNEESTETPQIKEEPEEEQLPVPVPESSAVCLKTEESSLLQQRQSEQREETQGEDISSEPRFHWEGHIDHVPNTHNDNWVLYSWSSAQMETEADKDRYNQVQTRDRSTKVSPQNRSAPETTVHSEHTWFASHKGDKEEHQGDHTRDEGDNLQCAFCNKRFGTIQDLESHIKDHTGETSDSEPHFRSESEQQQKKHQCLFCLKRFVTKQTLQTHIRLHTGEKPYACSICNKQFADPSAHRRHTRIHTGERPYRCSICNKTFTHKTGLNSHLRTHSDDKPYSYNISPFLP